MAAAQVSAQPGLTWSKPSINGTPPSSRGGHTAVLANNQLVIFGGHRYGGNNVFEYFNDVHVLDVETSTWHDVRCAGDPPAARYGHSATLIGRRMFVFGGRGQGGRLLNDMHLLDLDEWCWVRVSATTASPAVRFDHAACAVGSRIVLFGGWDGRQCFNDLWVFDASSFTWMRPKADGRPPSARHGGRMELLPDGRITVFGGHSTEDADTGAEARYHGDAVVLDVRTMRWSRPRATGESPSMRTGHTCCVVGGSVVVVGGWAGVRRSMVFEYLPVPDNFAERDVSLLKGFVAVLEAGGMEWSLPPCEAVEHPHRYGHSATVVGDYVFVWGGWDGNRPLNELAVLDISPLGLAS
eukprot:g687.t1